MRNVVLRPGSSGPFVRDLQLALNNRLNPSPNLIVNGLVTSQTQTALRSFQRANWLEEDGIAGPCTLDAIYDTEAMRPTPPSAVVANRVVFLGPTYMYPNKDGLEFFLAESWPLVRAASSLATLHLIGKNRPAEREAYASAPGVTPLGFVPDIRVPMAEAACSIVPLRIGGGTRLKILDAWALGKAVVSTSIGCEGLRAVDGENILIRDDPATFAAAVTEVLRNDALRTRLGAGGRATAEETYSWARVGRDLRADYHALLDASK